MTDVKKFKSTTLEDNNMVYTEMHKAEKKT